MLRAAALILAMISDGLDGYIARRYGMVSRLGTILDPIMDKFFVLFALIVLISENRLTLPEAGILISRDFAVVLFGFYLFFNGRLASYRFRAIWCGKLSTALQFIFLLGLTFHIQFPPYVFSAFIILGVLALVELYYNRPLSVEPK